MQLLQRPCSRLHLHAPILGLHLRVGRSITPPKRQSYSVFSAFFFVVYLYPGYFSLCNRSSSCAIFCQNAFSSSVSFFQREDIIVAVSNVRRQTPSPVKGVHASHTYIAPTPWSRSGLFSILVTWTGGRESNYFLDVGCGWPCLLLRQH